MKEDDFLNLLTDTFGQRSPSRVGIGDDAALLDTSEGEILVTVDAFVEGIHFPSWISMEDLSARATAAALSDINAVGGRGRFIFVVLGLPTSHADQLPASAEAMKRALNLYDLTLSGGDTVSSPVRFLSLTMIGHLPSGRPPLLRSGARPGDHIYLSGPIGGSCAGLELVRQGWAKDSGVWTREGGEPLKETQRLALEAYLIPKIPYPLGWNLHSCGLLHSAIDISDGLAIDLRRLCRESGVGARIRLEAIPRHPGAVGLDDQRLLSSGEDFQLLLTSARSGLSLHEIGTITPTKTIFYLREGREVEIGSEGYDHFPEG